MADAQYAPLTAAMVRALTDKLYEKRKTAALDIEKQVRELYASNQQSQLDRLLGVLRELAMAANGHTRKGGLIGLAAASIALGKNAGQYTSQLVEPVLSCFNDPDQRVRYYACESLYNIVKMCKTSALQLFDQLFDVLWKLSADTDQNVRSGAELLDRLLMDIVVTRDDFDIANLMSLIRDRMYTQTSSNRRFIVSWLNTMLSTPVFTVLPYASEVLDGLFRMLGDQQAGVRDVTETVLGQLLLGITKAPDTVKQEDMATMVNVLIVHAHENEPPLARALALVWLDDFIRLYQSRLLPHLSSYLTAILPALGNDNLRARACHDALLAVVDDESQVDMSSAIAVLLRYMRHERRETRVAVLNWIRHLHSKLPKQLFPHMGDIFPVLLSLINDTSDEVLLLDLQLLSDVCQRRDAHIDINEFNLPEETAKQLSSISPFLVKFSISLLSMFRDEPALLSERGVLIIRQLCLLLDPAHIYRALCVLALNEQSATFIQNVVSMLNGVLLTATELFVLRDELRELDGEETRSLFCCLYRCWAHRPVALLSLCLLSQNYAHAAELAMHLSQVDMTVDVLVEVDRLVNLLESPVFAYVRMDLLSACHQRSLTTVLSALLMLLPQSDAFHSLHKRLQTVPALTIIGKEGDAPAAKVDFGPLKECFMSALRRQQEEVRRRHRELLRNSIRHMHIQ